MGLNRIVDGEPHANDDFMVLSLFSVKERNGKSYVICRLSSRSFGSFMRSNKLFFVVIFISFYIISCWQSQTSDTNKQ